MESTMDFGTLLFRAAGSLLLVLAVLLAVLYLYKKSGRLPVGSAGGNGIRLLARKSVGPRHHLVMVEAADRQMLLGISPEGIRLLSLLGTATPPLQEKPAAMATEESQPAFPDLLQQMTGGIS